MVLKLNCKNNAEKVLFDTYDFTQTITSNGALSNNISLGKDYLSFTSDNKLIDSLSMPFNINSRTISTMGATILEINDIYNQDPVEYTSLNKNNINDSIISEINEKEFLERKNHKRTINSDITGSSNRSKNHKYNIDFNLTTITSISNSKKFFNSKVTKICENIFDSRSINEIISEIIRLEDKALNNLQYVYDLVKPAKAIVEIDLRDLKFFKNVFLNFDYIALNPPMTSINISRKLEISDSNGITLKTFNFSSTNENISVNISEFIKFEKLKLRFIVESEVLTNINISNFGIWNISNLSLSSLCEDNSFYISSRSTCSYYINESNTNAKLSFDYIAMGHYLANIKRSVIIYTSVDSVNWLEESKISIKMTDVGVVKKLFFMNISEKKYIKFVFEIYIKLPKGIKLPKINDIFSINNVKLSNLL